MKRAIASLTALLIGAGLAIVGIAAPASADGGTTTIPWSQPHNQASYWSDYGTHPDASCYQDSHGSLSQNGKSVKLPTFDPSWPGDHWELLVVKAGQFENVTLHPDAGTWYAAPEGKDVSHWIVCKGTTPPPQDAFDAAAGIDITPATCTTPGSAQVAGLANVTWDGVLDTTPGAHSELFTATAGHKFADGSATKTVEYTVPDKNLQLCPTNSCAAEYAGPQSTDLNDLWVDVDTRSAGHVKYVDGALHVWTDNNSSQAKVSEGYPASFLLKNTGVLDINATANPGNVHPYGPGLNLFVTFAPGLTGTLVYEEVYGQDLWLTNGSNAAVKANAPVIGGGNGSEWHGTIDQWLTKYPDAQVTGIAYSLGSGVHGDWNIASIIAGCTEYTFDKVDPPIIPDPVVEWTWTEWEDGQWQCNDTQVTITREATKTTTTYKLVVVEGQYQVVVDQVIVDDPIIETDVRQLDESEQTTCVTPLPPTFVDVCGWVDDEINIPEVEGVIYDVDTAEGDEDTVIVTASADEGYVLVPAEGEEQLFLEWQFTFTNEACPEVPPATPPTPTGLPNTGSDIGMGILIAAVLLAAGGAFTMNHLRRQRQQ